jgi:hypothetical protein
MTSSGSVAERVTTAMRNETTRYLCAAAHMDPDYADNAIREFLGEPLRAIPPSVAFDASLVLREAVAARGRRLLRDWLLVALGVAFFVTCGLGTAVAWLVVGLFGLMLGNTNSVTVTSIAVTRNVRQDTSTVQRALRTAATCLGGAAAITVIALGGTILHTYLTGSLLEGLGVSEGFVPNVGVVQIVLGFLMLGVLAADRFALSTLLTRSFRRGNFMSRPTLAEWPGERWLRTIGHDRYQRELARVTNSDQSGNLLVYRGFGPFVGAGERYRPISFAIPLEPAVMPGDGRGDAVAAQPFTLAELYDHISKHLLALRDSHSLAPSQRLAGLTESEQAIAPVDEVLLNFGNPLSRLVLPSLDQSPVESIAPEHLAMLAEDSLEWLRYYRCYRVETWDRDVTVSAYLHLGAGERMLYLEWTPCLLRPVAERYRKVNSVPVAPLVPLRDGLVDLLRLPYTLPGRTLRLFRRMRAKRQSVGLVQADRYGTLQSLREMGAGRDFDNYFQGTDVDRYLKLLERRLVRAVGEFLDARKISSTSFVAQAAPVVNNHAYINGPLIQSMSGGHVNTSYGSADLRGDVL